MNYNGMEFEGFLENEKLRIINNNNLNLTDNDKEYKKDYIKDDNWITIDEK